MKNTLINSVSLIAVTVMLSGCDPKGSEKSIKDLQQAVVSQGEVFSTIAGDVLKEARLEGVPLSSEVEEVLRGEQQDEVTPRNPEEMVSDLYAVFGDLDVLEFATQGSSVHSKKLFDAARAKHEELKRKAKLYGEQVRERNKLLAEARKKLNDEREKLELAHQVEKKTAVLGDDEAQERADVYKQWLAILGEAEKTREYDKAQRELTAAFDAFVSSLPVNRDSVTRALSTLENQGGAKAVRSIIPTVVASTILKGGDGNAATTTLVPGFGGNGNTAVTGGGAGRRLQFMLPVTNSNGSAAGAIGFSANLGGIVQRVTDVAAQWLEGLDPSPNRSAANGGALTVPSQNPSASTAPIPTDEAVRLTMVCGLQFSRFSEVVLGANADPELVAGLTNASTIAMLQQSKTFGRLPEYQQQLALRAVFAITHSTRPGDSLRLEDMVNASCLG